MSNDFAHLTVSRPGPGTISDNYLMSVSVDGELIGRLPAGRSVTRAIAPGRHRMRVHNTLVWKTVEFEAAPGQQLRFVAANRAGLMTTIMAIIGTGWFYLDVEREENA